MAIRAKIRLAGLLSATLALPFCTAGTSAAQDGSSVVNGQVQLGDVFSTQTLNVQEASEGVSASATTVGNIVAATGHQGPLDVASDQTVGGHVGAAVDATVAGASGPYFSLGVSATGNSATAGTCCAATTGSSLQAIESGAVVSADANGRTGGDAGGIAIDASAVGNTTGWEQPSGSVQAWTGQSSQGLTSAITTGTFASTPGNAGFTATAVSNNVTGDIADASSDLGFSQDSSGAGTSAAINVTLGAGVDIQAASTGVGNNVDIQASNGAASLNGVQSTSAPVNASASVNTATWSGDANVIAYGVGNSVLLSNSGPGVAMWSQQTAGGDVNATSTFTGGAGANLFGSATAIGNAVSGYACGACNGVLNATNTQTSSGRVRAASNVVVAGRARQVAAEANAVGNSATYQVVSPD